MFFEAQKNVVQNVGIGLFLLQIILLALLPQKGFAAAYDFAEVSYVGAALSVAAEDAVPFGMLFDNTGTKLYVLGTTGDDISEYALTTPFDISTGSFTQVALSVAAQEATPVAMVYNNDGTKLYVLGASGDFVVEYALSTQYDISTGTYTKIALLFLAQETNPRSMLYNNNGTKLYLLGTSGDDINEYALATPYDISTGTFTQVALSVATEDTAPASMIYNDDGTKLYVAGAGTDAIYEYTLATPYDISTGTGVQLILFVASEETTPTEIMFSNDGTKLYMLGTSAADIKEYTLVALDTESPSVAMTTPVDGAVISGEVELTASASDAVQVVSRQFYVNGEQAGNVSVRGSFRTLWDTTTVTDGVKTLVAVAQDSSGNTATSTAITITVQNNAVEVTPAPSSPKSSVVGGYDPVARAAYLAELGDTIALRSLLEQRLASLMSQLAALQPAKKSVAGVSVTVFAREFGMQDEGDDVRALQQYLVQNGYAIPAGATGYFGGQTRDALIALQHAHNIEPATGHFGPKTRSFLNSVSTR